LVGAEVTRLEVRALSVVLVIAATCFIVAWANAHGIDGKAVAAGTGVVCAAGSWLFKSAKK